MPRSATGTRNSRRPALGRVLAWQAARAAPFVGAADPFGVPSPLLGPDTAARRARPACLSSWPTSPLPPRTTFAARRPNGGPGEPVRSASGRAAARGRSETISSSGTTGEPVIFALTDADLAVWRDGIAAGFFAAGIRRDDVVAHLVGLPGMAGGSPYADGFRRIGATLAWIGGLPTERIIQVIPRLQASAVLSTTSFGTYLADRCQDLTGQDASALGVRTLLGGGEPGLGQPEIRDRIIGGWGLDHACELMGLGDVMALLWAECEAEGGMHFCGQRSVAVELIDPASGAVLPWEEGVRGEAVYTTFAREATPVLRYRSADHLVVTAMSCPCGRTSPRIRCVGRTDDMLIYKAMNVFPSAIRDVVMRRFPGAVEPYLRIWKDRADQVRYDTPIPVDVEASPGLAAGRYEEVARAVERELRARLQIRADVTILDPDTLPRTTYKTPLLHVRETGVSRCISETPASPSASAGPRHLPVGKVRWPSSPASTLPSTSPSTRSGPRAAGIRGNRDRLRLDRPAAGDLLRRIHRRRPHRRAPCHRGDAVTGLRDLGRVPGGGGTAGRGGAGRAVLGDHHGPHLQRPGPDLPGTVGARRSTPAGALGARQFPARSVGRPVDGRHRRAGRGRGRHEPGEHRRGRPAALPAVPGGARRRPGLPARLHGPGHPAGRRGEPVVIEGDVGIHPTSAEGLAKLAPADAGRRRDLRHPDPPRRRHRRPGRHDGRASRELAGGEGIARILGTGVARVGQGEMPKAPVPAAQAALDQRRAQLR